jgi:ParB-like chromosome segregation protein Spo0J
MNVFIEAIVPFTLNNKSNRKEGILQWATRMSLRLNPEYEKLLPKMSEEEFAQLKESIQSEGQHYPIIVNEDLEVLDGHHRYRACTELGLEPDFEVRKFEDKLLEKKFVIEANLRRRHLNNFQLVELAVPLLEIEKALAKKRQSRGGKNGRDQQLGLELAPDDADPEFKAKATEVVAKKAGVSTRTFERGKKIIEEASEDDKQKLREGKTSISKVYSEIVSEKPRIEKEVAQETELKHESPREVHNKAELLAILERMINQEIFCPDCGNSMFECSKCRKTIQELLKQQKKS